MAPKKQAKPNAYSVFVQEFKNKQGRKFNNMAEAFQAAAPHWQNMSKEQRRPYEEKAKALGNALKPGKFTSEGKDVDLLQQEEHEKEQFKLLMKDDISNILTTASRNNRIDEEIFCIIHINMFFEDSEKEDKRYYPAEIGVAAFNLKDGIKQPSDVFHSLIKPGPLPLGSRFSVKLNCDIHRIQEPSADSMEDNQRGIFYDLIEFLKARMVGSKRIPILYALDRDMERVQNTLNMWSKMYDPNVKLTVYNLQWMFWILKNTTACDEVWISETPSHVELDKDVYAYAPNIACEYHELSSSTLYCSRSAVCRYAFIVCDNCSPYLGIPLIPGCHVPSTANIDSQASDTLSVRSGTLSSRAPARHTNPSIDLTWETESSISDISTVSLRDNYPSLPGSSRNATPSNNLRLNNNSSSTANISLSGSRNSAWHGNRSAALPFEFDRGLQQLSTNDEKAFPSLSAPRGRGSRITQSPNFLEAVRGKPMGRGFRKPEPRT